MVCVCVCVVHALSSRVFLCICVVYALLCNTYVYESHAVISGRVLCVLLSYFLSYFLSYLLSHLLWHSYRKEVIRAYITESRTLKWCKNPRGCDGICGGVRSQGCKNTTPLHMRIKTHIQNTSGGSTHDSELLDERAKSVCEGRHRSQVGGERHTHLHKVVLRQQRWWKRQSRDAHSVCVCFA